MNPDERRILPTILDLIVRQKNLTVKRQPRCRGRGCNNSVVLKN